MVAVRSSRIVISVQSLMLSDQLLHCRYCLRSPSTVSCTMVLLRLLCHVKWSKHVFFRRLIVVIKYSRCTTILLTLSRWFSICLYAFRRVFEFYYYLYYLSSFDFYRILIFFRVPTEDLMSKNDDIFHWIFV